MIRWRLVIWLGVAVLLIAGWAAPASATPLLRANAWIATGFPPCGEDPIQLIGKTLADCGGLTGTQQIAPPSSVGPVTAGALDTLTPNGVWTFGGEAHSKANYGILGASAKDTSTCTLPGSPACGGPAMGFAFGAATFTETMIFIPPPPEVVGCNPPPGLGCKNPVVGDGGSFIPTFTITGSASGGHVFAPTGGLDARGLGVLAFGPACKPDPSAPLGVFCTPASGHVFFENIPLTSSSVTETGWSVPFTWGMPLDFTVGFGASTSGVNFDNNSAFADYLATVTLSKIEIHDSSGDLITGWDITSASGTLYGPDGVTAPTPPPPSGATVPEPGTRALLGVALAGLATSVRGRTRPRG